jgi:hypothetical protein
MHYQINYSLSGYVVEFYLQGELIAVLNVTTSNAEKPIKNIELEQKFGSNKTGNLFYFDDKLIQSRNQDLVIYWLNQVEEKL